MKKISRKQRAQRTPLPLMEEEVLAIHDALTDDFRHSDDPISPPGLRDQGLLSSAVARQWTSLGPTLKYPDAIANAATLTYGICNNHAFFNGNKRTALVAMLAHLDRNSLALFGTSQPELYDFIIRVADHGLSVRVDPRAARQREERRDPDEEVAAMIRWLQPRVDTVVRGERIITYRELRRILSKFGYHLEDPKGNRISICAYQEVTTGILRRRQEIKRIHIGSIPWPGESRQMAIGDIRYVRKLCRLTEEDGVDSGSFYDYLVIIDSFINHYRKILTRLARV